MMGRWSCAARQAGVTRVIAHTTAANPGSMLVLARSGFVSTGPGADPGMLRFEYAARAGGPVAPLY